MPGSVLAPNSPCHSPYPHPPPSYWPRPRAAAIMCIKEPLPDIGFLCSWNVFGRFPPFSGSLGSLNTHFLYFRLDYKVFTTLRASYPSPPPSRALVPASPGRAGTRGREPWQTQPFATSSAESDWVRTIQTAVCRRKTEGPRAAKWELPRTQRRGPRSLRPGSTSPPRFSDARFSESCSLEYILQTGGENSGWSKARVESRGSRAEELENAK